MEECTWAHVLGAGVQETDWVAYVERTDAYSEMVFEAVVDLDAAMDAFDLDGLSEKGESDQDAVSGLGAYCPGVLAEKDACEAEAVHDVQEPPDSYAG